MKFTIVTPCLDRHRFLDETIMSVVSQRGDFEIEYIIQDGGSGPEVLEILEKWKNRIDSGVFEPACRSLTFQYFTETDSGMYDAINKGFAKGTGELLAWINSDDSYFPSAFAAVNQAMTQHEDIDWLIGKAAKYNAPGNVTYVAGHPNCYSRKFINLGYYRNELFKFSWLSQDSIFWRKSLWDACGPLSTRDRLVADFRLWQSFAANAELVKIETLTAGYRSHGDQLTADPAAYRKELVDLAPVSIRLRLVSNLFKAMPFLRHLAAAGLSQKLLAGCMGVEPADLMGGRLTWDDATESWILTRQSIFG